MLRSLNELERYEISATDGDVGSVQDFLLDDEHWAIRYLVASTGGWLGGRRVLISPISFREAEWPADRFHLSLTRKMIEDSPSIETDQPVSRQHEREYFRYYSYPYYWGYAGLWGMGAYPGLLSGGRLPSEAAPERPERADDVHLRSAKEVHGYHIQGSDEAIGHVDDFVVDDETWQVRYLVIDTRNWWFGKQVLIAPQWASRISWAERTIYVDLPRDTIEHAPEWNSSQPVDRAFETRLHDHYRRPGYWGDVGSSMAVTAPRRPERRPH